MVVKEVKIVHEIFLLMLLVIICGFSFDVLRFCGFRSIDEISPYPDTFPSSIDSKPGSCGSSAGRRKSGLGRFPSGTTGSINLEASPSRSVVVIG